jgi:predicted nucleic acid-binding protein
LFEETSEVLVVPQVVLAEAAYLVGKLAGPIAEVEFVRQLADERIDLHALDPEDLHRMADLMETYADLHLGIVDAAVIAIAERLEITTIATIDHRDFSVVRPRHVSHFELLP